MSTERATERRAKSSRRIKLPGGREEYSNRTAAEIAKELRAKSELGRREAKLGVKR